MVMVVMQIQKAKSSISIKETTQLGGFFYMLFFQENAAS